MSKCTMEGTTYQQQTEINHISQLLLVHFEKWAWTSRLVTSLRWTHSITYIAMQRRSVCAEVKPSPCKYVPWTSQYMDWYVFHLHRWTDSRPNWRQLQRVTLGKSCTKVEATSDTQNVFLLERQEQAPFYIHGNHYAYGTCMLRWKCSSLPFHRGVQKYSLHTSGITNKTSWQCYFVDPIVNVPRRANFCYQN